MRNFIKVIAIAGALLGCATASQAGQESTEAGIDNAQNHAAYGHGAYAQYHSGYGHHHHHRGIW